MDLPVSNEFIATSALLGRKSGTRSDSVFRFNIHPHSNYKSI